MRLLQLFPLRSTALCMDVHGYSSEAGHTRAWDLSLLIVFLLKCCSLHLNAIGSATHAHSRLCYLALAVKAAYFKKRV